MEGGLGGDEARLRLLFDGCGGTSSGFLDGDGLAELCRRLQLEGHTHTLQETLLHTHNYGQVSFQDFHRALLDVLSPAVDVLSPAVDVLSPAVDVLSPAVDILSPAVDVLSPAVDILSPALDVLSPAVDVLSPAVDVLSPALDVLSPALDVLSPAVDVLSPVLDVLSPAVDILSPAVDVLSPALDSSSEDDTSYLDPVIPEVEQPKLVVGLKRYGRRSRPEAFLTAGWSPEVRRSSSLDSVESLKSEEDKRRRSCCPSAGGVQPISIQDCQSDSTLFSCSTPVKSADLQMASHMAVAVLGAEPGRTASPSLLTAAAGQTVLSRLDDGSGFTSPDRVEGLWREEGLRNGREVLQTLDFPVDERLSLADLTLALDNELLVSGNGIHQAALLSYKDEVQHLQDMLDAARRQRDRLRTDLDRSDLRNLQLVREAEDRQAGLETRTRTRIRALERDCRDRVWAARLQAEQESEALLEQARRDSEALLEELAPLRRREAELKEELSAAARENQGLHQQLDSLKLQLGASSRSAEELRGELQLLLLHQFGGTDAAGEDRLSETIRDYELQCRELRDRNDELSAELELLQGRRTHTGTHTTQAHSDDSDMKRSSSPPDAKKLKPVSPDRVPAGVSIQTELALEQLKQKHEEELQQLHVQLETQVNYYERRLELMRQSMEVERKDISQAFKLEISELEEQKQRVEQQVEQLRDTVDRLSNQLPSGGRGWSGEQERRMQREQAEVEQNFATEIRNLVEQLRMEKEQLEAELKLTNDQELQRLRAQLEVSRSESSSLQERLHLLQQEVQTLEEEAEKRRRKLQESEREQQRSREEQERLQRENSRFHEEVLQLSSRNLQLSEENAALTSRLHGEQESVRTLRERREEEGLTVSQSEGGAGLRGAAMLRSCCVLQVRRLQDAKTLLEEELSGCKRQLIGQRDLEAELRGAEEDKRKLLRDAEDAKTKVEMLQRSLVSMETQVEHLLFQVNEDKLGHAHQVSQLQLQLQQAQDKVEQLESSLKTVMEEKEQQEAQNLGAKDQVLKLKEEQQSVRSRLKLEEEAHMLAQDQALRATAALSQLQEQLQRAQEAQRQEAQQQEAQQQEAQREEAQRQEAQRQEAQQREAQREEAQREAAQLLQVQLEEEQRRSQKLEEVLKLRSEQQQGQYEKTLSVLQRHSEELQLQLKAVQLLLQEKAEQLKEELLRSRTCSSRLKEAYVENVQLMAALSVTERRQKEAEKKSRGLEDQLEALKQLLTEVVSVALAT
ncbi:ninein-like protein [Salarias fasciatus]|uniref:ninein-like protein n=1 Tax=Salarias fasciatus TaxID=181472 RepID=UPI0011766D8A|nr:ninein-like protein [Salarias fasciatus]